ncbi:hypothetical protein BBAD15_g2556 [Beauveria bassiana D1-5]|uniref:Uncharacterized protein n=1 Tax=Beauveria bassiana D1-5 TaxID=1245745 RepID=A0A0A2WF21_BEABA|nr:hypothetical protein BBAD15_g2556 [Beauveria bassiana D1-5]
MELKFELDAKFEQDTHRYHFKQACREKLIKPGDLKPPAICFFWQAADRNTHTNLHRGRVEVGFGDRASVTRAEKELHDRGRKVQVERAARRRWAHKILEGDLASSTTAPPPPPPPPPSTIDGTPSPPPPPPAENSSGSTAGFPVSSVYGVPYAAAVRAAAVETAAAAVKTTTSAAAAAAGSELAACAEALAAAQAKYATAASAATVAAAAYTAAVDADAAATAAPAGPPLASTIVEEDYNIIPSADIAEKRYQYYCTAVYGY